LPWSARSLGWRHEPAALFDQLRASVARSELESVAAADYGRDIPQNLAALDEMVATGHIRHPLNVPLEVLQLERWNEGDEIDHYTRAFCCAALLLDDAGPAPSWEGNEATIAVLAHSCIALGTQAVDNGIGFFAALANTYDSPIMRAFAELALITLASWRDADDPRIAPAVQRIIHDEAQIREVSSVSTQWLFGLTWFVQRNPLFRELVMCTLPSDSPIVARLR
jgi:hypothetical protein